MTPSSTEAVAELTGVTKVYRRGVTRTHALRGVDLRVDAGELLMLTGPSGCGKTTLISVLAGILDATEGQARVLGLDLNAATGGQKRRMRAAQVGFVFQQFNLLPTLTAAENVSVPLLLNGVARGEATERAAAMLGRVGLGDRAGALPRELSGGQQQRVAIARALVHEPRLIVADEPTSALDQETGRQVMDVFQEVALADGRALVIVTHDSRIYDFADRIAAMEDGAVTSVQRKGRTT